MSNTPRVAGKFSAIGGSPHNHAHVRGRNRHSPTYISWLRIRQRCQCKTAHNYQWYGGKGVKLCDRWQQFVNFLADMGERPTDHSIDRIDSAGNYEPVNCRWATKVEQANNQASNHRITANGVTKNLCQWAREIGVTKGTLRKRLLKMSPEQAVNKIKHPYYPRAKSL